MKRPSLNLVLALAALALTIIALVKAIEVGYTNSKITATRTVAKADDKEAPKTHPDDDRAKRVTERNIFAPPKPKGFQGRLTGVLGDEAIFNGSQAGKVGGNVMGAKVLSIGPDWVEIEFEGKKQKLWVFQPRN